MKLDDVKRIYSDLEVSTVRKRAIIKPVKESTIKAVISVMDRYGGTCTATDVFNALNMSRTTTNNALNVLVDRGLVTETCKRINMANARIMRLV